MTKIDAEALTKGVIDLLKNELTPLFNRIFDVVERLQNENAALRGRIEKIEAGHSGASLQ